MYGHGSDVMATKKQKIAIVGVPTLIAVLTAFISLGGTITDWEGNNLTDLHCIGNLSFIGKPKDTDCVLKIMLTPPPSGIVFPKQMKGISFDGEASYIAYNEKGNKVTLNSLSITKPTKITIKVFKKINETIKWSLTGDGMNIDPALIGYKSKDIITGIERMNWTIDHAIVIYNKYNPTNYSMKVDNTTESAQFVELKNHVTSYKIEYFGEKTIITEVPIYSDSCYPYIITENKTKVIIDNCTLIKNGSVIKKELVKDWIPVNSTSIQPFETMKLRATIYYPISMNTEIDWQPVTKVSDTTFIREDLTWINTSFAYKRRINITETGDQLTGFTINFTMDTKTGIGDSGKLRTDGYDIILTNCEETAVIPYHPVNGTSTTVGINTTKTSFWVKLPSFNSTSCVYMYYGCPTASIDPTDKFNTYDSGWYDAFHFGEESGTNIQSSTIKRTNMTITNGAWFNDAGVINGVNFTTGGYALSTANWFDALDTSKMNLTFFLKFKMNKYNSAGINQYFIEKRSATNVITFRGTIDSGNGKPWIEMYKVGTDKIAQANTSITSNFSWITVGGIWNTNAQTMCIYMNGIMEKCESTASMNSDTTAVPLGFSYDVITATEKLNGTIDEVYIFTRPLDINELNIYNGNYAVGIGGEESQAVDACAYTSGNYNMPCGCNITTAMNLGKNIWNITGSGTTKVSARIQNMSKILKSGGCLIAINKTAGGQIW